MKITEFALNETKVEGGVWVEAGEGLRLRLARLGNVRYAEYLRKLGRPLRRKLRKDTHTIQEIRELTCKAMARHVLLGWENLTDAEDKPIPYSEEKANELLLKYGEFRELVEELSSDTANFQDDDEDEEILGKQSDGTPNGRPTAKTSKQ